MQLSKTLMQVRPKYGLKIRENLKRTLDNLQWKKRWRHRWRWLTFKWRMTLLKLRRQNWSYHMSQRLEHIAKPNYYTESNQLINLLCLLPFLPQYNLLSKTIVNRESISPRNRRQRSRYQFILYIKRVPKQMNRFSRIWAAKRLTTSKICQSSLSRCIKTIPLIHWRSKKESCSSRGQKL